MEMSSVMYNLLSILITGGMTLLLVGLFHVWNPVRQRWIKLYASIACSVMLYGMSLFLIHSLLLMDHIVSKESLFSSLYAFLISMCLLAFLFLIAFVIKKILGKLKLFFPSSQVVHFINFYVLVFILVYILLWHITIPYLSDVMQIVLQEVQSSDEILLLILCSVGLLMDMVSIKNKSKENDHLYDRVLTNEEAEEYRNFIRKTKNGHAKY